MPALKLATLFKPLRLLAFYAALIGFWYLIVELAIWPSYVLPGPDGVFRALRRVAENGALLESVEVTMRRMAIGFAVAFLLGMIIGVACASLTWFDETFGTLVLGLQSLPSVTWTPLAILWFGLNEKAIIFVVLMGSVFAIAISARDGVRNIPPIHVRAARVFGASRLQMLRYITLPAMLPPMVQGLKLGWSFSWRSLMAGELIFVSFGIGHLLDLGRNLSQMGLVIGMMLVIVVIGLGVNYLIFAPMEKWVRERWGLAGPRVI